jgi:tRNA modification GTPase
MLATAGPAGFDLGQNGSGHIAPRIREAAGVVEPTGGLAAGSFSARQRHVDALKRAGRHLEAGRQVMSASQAGELLAEELRLAQQALGELTGELLPDDLLGEIFASFCIGK